VRQLLTEGIVLASTAVTLCLLVSPIVARAVLTRVEASLAPLLDFSLDGRVVMFSAALTVIACVVSSLAPALRDERHRQAPDRGRRRAAARRGQVPSARRRSASGSPSARARRAFAPC
jgi:hypothetical protein